MSWGWIPLNNATVLTCCSCSLNFMTGNLISSNSQMWLFNSGGTVTLTGGIDMNGGTDCTDAETDVPIGTTVFTGSFTDSVVVTKQGTTTVKIAGGSFQDTKDPALLNVYGLANGLYFGNFNISLDTPQTPGSPSKTFTSTRLFSGNVSNCNVP